MSELIVRDNIEIAASASRVWEVLTKPEYTIQYMFGCEPVTDWQPGSAIDWRGAADGKVYVRGTIAAIVPGQTLQYTTFAPDAPDHYEDKPENYTTVTLELTPVDGDTRLSVSQGDFSRVAAGELRFQHTVNSWKATLARIKTIAETSPMTVGGA